MIKYIIIAISVLSLYGASPMPTGDSVVANDKEYFKYKFKNTEIIYSKENLYLLQKTYNIETQLQNKYKDIYDWDFDETLYVGLISSYNQIANGFSTQWPNNRQINYIGGTQKIDYFCSTSWLSTLLYHETAHNYQVNLKNNSISSSLHSVFGNGVVFFPLPLIMPNVAENPFMFEGNAVLNESWHGNGGRLYSGRFKAETIMQAKAGYLKAKYLYNQRLGFPYGDISYIQGGFYHLYMGESYGLKNINSYFTNHSKYWYWPFMTNLSMEETVGKSFEETIIDFEDYQYSLLKDFQILDAKHILSSQFFYPLNSDIDEIYFLINKDGVSAPFLVNIEKKDFNIKTQQKDFMGGKIIKSDMKYYVQGSAKVSPTRIIQGLYDDDKILKDDTYSKMVQGYLSDGSIVYFNVATSFDEPQLYINNNFYDTANSSVFIDNNDNIYYFKQEGKIRILYKNKKPLFSYSGYYGIVSDVMENNKIYFIANSKLGSTLYCYDGRDIYRINSADNIIDAKIIDNNNILVAAIGKDEYYYSKISHGHIKQSPYDTKLFFEEKNYIKIDSDINTTLNIDLNKTYNSLLDMHYSGTNFGIGYIDNIGIVGSLNINFADPLAQNSANLFISRDASEVTIAGAGYESSLFILQYNFMIYGVVDSKKNNELRDYGISLGATLPIYTKGYYYASLSTNYFQDYDTLKREPLSGVFTLKRSTKFGKSYYYNSLNLLKLYGVNERDDNIYGGSYEYLHDLDMEFYIGFKTKYSKSDFTKKNEDRGVKISTTPYQEDMDPSVIDMPSSSDITYVKKAAYIEANIAKVLNFSKYYFTFPLSLRRESIYAKYRYYDIIDSEDIKYNVHEILGGLSFDSVVLNSYKIPVNFEYIYSDTEFIKDKNSFRVLIGVEF
jgi:hypothetical protein